MRCFDSSNLTFVVPTNMRVSRRFLLTYLVLFLYKMKHVEKVLLDTKNENALLIQRHQEMEFEVAQRDAEIISIKKDLEASGSRCDELMSESNAVLKAKASALEELHVTKKKYFEAKKSVARGTENTDDQSGEVQFTAKQLSTQLDVYKGRLACPVCNNRDKSCILLRCRHMFCRQCVDTSIKVSLCNNMRDSSRNHFFVCVLILSFSNMHSFSRLNRTEAANVLHVGFVLT